MHEFIPGGLPADAQVVGRSGESVRATAVDVDMSFPKLHEASAGELVQVALGLFENERFRESAALLRYVLVFRSRAVPVWAWLGRCHELLGEFSTAATIYEAAAVVAPEGRAAELRQCAARALVLSQAQNGGRHARR